ncbi:MAG: serine hydrolase [Aliidongia sp.]
MVAVAITAIIFPGVTRKIIYGPASAPGSRPNSAAPAWFVMHRAPEDVMAQDVVPTDPLLAHATLAVEKQQQSATVTLLGVFSRTAIYRPGLGCTLLNQRSEASLRGQTAGLKLMARTERPEPWPAGDAVDLNHPPEGVDKPALDAAVAGAFDETALGGKIDTRAIIVAWHGRILAERYAPGFDRGTRMLGWSMGKSVTSALIGTLVADGKLSLDAPPPIPALRQATDGRQAITLKQLLQMKSGLAFKETYGPGDDSTTMLFGRDDMAGYAAAMPLAHPPGTVWAYSSGTANILAHLVFDEAGGDLVHNYDYARQHLFEPAGMTSAEFAPDGTGSFVGSSYPYMTARDWARFGQLYLDGGEINGQRVLPADWVAFSHESAGRTNEPGSYGGQFWLNTDGANPASIRWPHVPADTYMALGHNDEIVAIVPSRQLVFVRLGWSTGGAGFDTDTHLSRILASLQKRERCPIGLPVPAPEQMSPAQRHVVDAILAGPRGSLDGPFRAWLHSPELADRLQHVGEYVRFGNVLPRRLSEFAILITARHWTAQFEWYAHHPLALAAGLAPEIATAIAEDREPAALQPDERAVYDFATQLHRTGRVGDTAYDAAKTAFGEQGVVDLVGICGYYTIVAMTLNVAEVGLPPGEPLPLAPRPIR